MNSLINSSINGLINSWIKWFTLGQPNVGFPQWGSSDVRMFGVSTQQRHSTHIDLFDRTRQSAGLDAVTTTLGDKERVNSCVIYPLLFEGV